MPNRLADETSPYLLQHKDNPVDWYPWGEEAFAKAKAEDKPVFLSVGYSSCHWCHVMEHESFEDEEVAAILNEYFVPVKVDREERPDVDETYMTAVQLTTRRGGWPMSVFMTPDKKPFFAGTYFPKENRGQHPGFLSVCAQIAQVWQNKRSDILQAGDQIAEAIRESRGVKAPETASILNENFIAQGIAAILGDFDPDNGGFGNAPKFPPHTGIELLMAYAMRPSAPGELRQAAISAALYTLQKMVFGGIHDHVGGGFHRYSTDAEWKLPHFEKMLVDNVLMLGNLVRAAGIAEQFEPRLARAFDEVAGSLIGFLDREMTAPEGYFYSAHDADTEGEEGRFYVWSVDEIRDVLGDRAEAFLDAYNFQNEGNFHDEATGQLTGFNIPYATRDLGGQFFEELGALRSARESRVRPGLDDKALVGWNGLAIGALAESGILARAERAALAILDAEARHGRLPHHITKGKPSGEAYLDDYAYFTDGLLRLATTCLFLLEGGQPPATQNPPEFYIEHAARLRDEMVEKFYDSEHGGFFMTGPDHEELLGRTKPVFDQPQPSANAVAIRVLIATGEDRRGPEALQSFVGWMERAPQSTEALYATALLAVEEGAEPLPLMEVQGQIGVETETVVIDSGSMTDSEVAATKPSKPEDVSVSLSPREVVADAQGKGEIRVKIVIPADLHLNSSEPPARWLTPTKVVVNPLKATVAYPVTGDRYEGTVEIPVIVELPSGSSGEEFEVRVSYQACTESECLLAKERVLSGVIVRG